jgi:hypothetical protein
MVPLLAEQPAVSSIAKSRCMDGVAAKVNVDGNITTTSADATFSRESAPIARGLAKARILGYVRIL